MSDLGEVIGDHECGDVSGLSNPQKAHARKKAQTIGIGIHSSTIAQECATAILGPVAIFQVCLGTILRCENRLDSATCP
jgi:hypothetical protein